MDTQFIKQLLNKQFYIDTKANLSKRLFDDDVLELYEVLVESHEKYDSNLTEQELFELWRTKNPVAAKASVNNMQELVKRIENEELFSYDVAKDLLTDLWRRKTGERIANLGIAMSEGKSDAFDKVTKIIEDNREGFLPTEFGDETTKDLEALLALTSDDARFRFNIPNLSRYVYGIGRQEFGILFARPETGKTAFGVSLAFGPGGFAEQGRKVLYLGNEEAAERTMLRAYQAFTGMTKQEITNNPSLAVERFELIEDKVTMMGIQGWDFPTLEAYVEKKEPDVVIIDQADKVGVEGSFDADHQRIRQLYISLRELAKRQNCALLGVSQASVEAEGKTVLTPSMMEGSKTGKFAEADLIIGVGKYPDPQDGSPNSERFLTVGKNKLSGWHGTQAVKLEQEISRYVD